jgi:hypothetical protein
MSELFLKAPKPESIRLIDFKKAEVRPGIVPNTWFLIVSGIKPCLNMTVALSPRIYIRQPDYWGIEVVGSLHGTCIVGIAPAPYHVSLPLHGIIGKKGIEVIGATTRKKIDVPPKAKGKGKK